jgi:hypothetical protein
MFFLSCWPWCCQDLQSDFLRARKRTREEAGLVKSENFDD